MLQESELSRLLVEALAGRGDLIVGIGTGVRNDGTINVTDGRRSRNAIACRGAGTGACVAVRASNGKWYAVGEQESQEISSSVVRSRHYQRKANFPSIIYPFKILFSVREEGIDKVYIGGDRATPVSIFTVPSVNNFVIQDAQILNIGPKPDDWKATVKYGNSIESQIVFLSPSSQPAVISSGSDITRVEPKGGNFWVQNSIPSHLGLTSSYEPVFQSTTTLFTSDSTAQGFATVPNTVGKGRDLVSQIDLAETYVFNNEDSQPLKEYNFFSYDTEKWPDSEAPSNSWWGQYGVEGEGISNSGQIDSKILLSSFNENTSSSNAISIATSVQKYQIITDGGQYGGYPYALVNTKLVNRDAKYKFCSVSDTLQSLENNYQFSDVDIRAFRIGDVALFDFSLVPGTSNYVYPFAQKIAPHTEREDKGYKISIEKYSGNTIILPGLIKPFIRFNGSYSKAARKTIGLTYGGSYGGNVGTLPQWAPAESKSANKEYFVLPVIVDVNQTLAIAKYSISSSHTSINYSYQTYLNNPSASSSFEAFGKIGQRESLTSYAVSEGDPLHYTREIGSNLKVEEYRLISASKEQVCDSREPIYISLTNGSFSLPNEFPADITISSSAGTYLLKKYVSIKTGERFTASGDSSAGFYTGSRTPSVDYYTSWFPDDIGGITSSQDNIELIEDPFWSNFQSAPIIIAKHKFNSRNEFESVDLMYGRISGYTSSDSGEGVDKERSCTSLSIHLERINNVPYYHYGSKDGVIISNFGSFKEIDFNASAGNLVNNKADVPQLSYFYNIPDQNDFINKNTNGYVEVFDLVSSEGNKLKASRQKKILKGKIRSLKIAETNSVIFFRKSYYQIK